MTEATAAGGSTVPRRQLGRYLRDLRGQARLTIRAAADALEWSDAKIWRIETGQTAMRGLDVEAMCRIYGASAELTASLMALAKETKSRGWWLSYNDVINEGFDVYIGLEEAAAKLSWYEAELVPGLLQTPGYARTLIRAGHPEMGDEEIARRVQLRMARQSLLTRVTSAPMLNVVLNEAIVRRPVGGPRPMAEQLTHLLEVSTLPNVSMRVVRFASGFHYGIASGPFVLLEFPTNGLGQPTEPPVVYKDSYTGALYLDKPREIARYASAFKDICRVASNEVISRDFLYRTVKEFEE